MSEQRISDKRLAEINAGGSAFDEDIDAALIDLVDARKERDNARR